MLTDLPTTVGRLSALMRLVAGQNHLTSLPQQIGGLVNLQVTP